MNKNVTIAFTEPKDGEKQKEKIRKIIAGGFYGYLKRNGYFRETPGKKPKIEKILEESRQICQGINSIDLA